MYMLHDQIMYWQNHVLQCTENFSIGDECDLKIFATVYTDAAVASTNKAINCIDFSKLLGIKQNLETPKKFVGKIHTVYHNFVDINIKAKEVAVQLHTIVDEIIESHLVDGYCSLMPNILNYIRSTIHNYTNFIDKLNTKSPNFYISHHNLDIQSSYLYGTLVAMGASSLHMVDSQILLNPKSDTNVYITQLCKILSNLLHGMDCTRHSIPPMMLDHCLRCAYATMHNSQFTMHN